MRAITMTNVTTEVPFQKCVGCLSCAAICPVSCLTPLQDKAGFTYVTEEGSSCINCGKCLTVCPALHEQSNGPVLRAAWAQAIDHQILERSSSGGLFRLLADKILSDCGAVYGVALDSALRAKHIRVTDQDSLALLLGSKYVQSFLTSEIFSQVSEDLSSGRKVLFSGTPCQTEAMVNYLHANNTPLEELTSVSIICHGVPSPKLWSGWVQYLEAEEGSAIRRVFFRDKTYGWKNFAMRYEFCSGACRITPFSSDWFMNAFLKNASLRPSCFNCPSKAASGSDIILGDFWGIEAIHPEINNENGISAVIATSKKGLQILAAIEKDACTGEASFQEIAAHNSALQESVKPFAQYSDFMSQVERGADIPTLMKTWSFKTSFKERLKRKIRRVYHKVRGA